MNRKGLGSATALVALTLWMGTPTMAQSNDETPTRLTALAGEARTSAEHAKVAKEYRLQAESFEATAAEYDATVKRLSKNPSPMTYKWPSMASPDLVQAKQKAVEARRAARESRELADHHLRRSVEALADN